jgi:BMFP domain-containing protein YqiC
MATKTDSDPQSEVDRLQARIKELEDRLNARSSKADGDRDRNALQDIANRKVERAARALRGMTLASFEAVRLTADTVMGAASTFLDRNRPGKEHRSVRELARNIPGDLIDSAADAVDDLVEIPAKVADKFADAYREGEGEGRRRRSA